MVGGDGAKGLGEKAPAAEDAVGVGGEVDRGAWPTNTPDHARVAYDLPTIKRWLELFLRRFFANQFKRSAMPNGPKISSGGALSPRGDWRMPSDATASAWLKDLERVPD